MAAQPKNDFFLLASAFKDSKSITPHARGAKEQETRIPPVNRAVLYGWRRREIDYVEAIMGE
jgi:hypothetical protein